jgi:hypothetical protein
LATRTLTRLLDFREFSLLPPPLSASEKAVEQNKKDVRRKVLLCVARIDRIESILDLGRVDEALALSWTLVAELFYLACLLYGKDRELITGAIKEPWRATETLSVLEEGEIRDKLNELLHELDAAKVDSAEDRIVKAQKSVALALEILERVEGIFKERCAHELRTPLNRYKQLLVHAALAFLALAIVPGAIGYAFYSATRPRITILNASFGENCIDKSGLTASRGASAGLGNATRPAALICNGAAAGCEFSITANQFGEPAPFCAKDFRVIWTCSGDAALHAVTIPAEATGRTVSLTCHNAPRVEILEATYGGNCRDKPALGGAGFAVTQGNMTGRISHKCNFGDGPCSMVVELGQMADPAPQCSKDFEVLWTCTGENSRRKSRIEPESLGKAMTLSCR